MTKDEQVREAVKIDLSDARDALESLSKTLPKMSMADKVDLGARVSALRKASEAIENTIKDEIKTHLGDKAGTIPGRLFKAVMNLVPTTRLNQQKLKAEQPKIHARYNEDVTDKRVTYTVR